MATADAAKAIAASIINGDILQATYTDEVMTLRVANDYLPLEHGPVTSVDTVKIGDDTITAGDDDGYTVERFGIKRKYGYEWPAGPKITVTYTTGWADGSEPTNVAEALSMLETWIDAKPELGMSQIEIGEESVARPATIATVTPEAARILLRPWVRPSTA